MITVLKKENFIKDFRNPLTGVDKKTIFESILASLEGELTQNEGWYFIEWYTAMDQHNLEVCTFVTCYDMDTAWSYVIL